MLRALKLVPMFLAFGALGWTTDRVAEVLAAGWDGRGGGTAHADVVIVETDAMFIEAEAMLDEMDIDVDVDVDVDVQVPTSGECAYGAERRVSLPAAAVRQLRLDAGSGALVVTGRAGLGEVQAVGRACASDADDLDALELTLDRVGDDLVLSAHYPDDRGRRGSRFGGDRYARIDLTVEMPAGMALDLEDSSGSLEVSETGELRIADSSGGIRVRRVDGAVTIDDSSGEIDLEDVAGDVDVRDGSGEISLRDVRGGVRIEDGSGSIGVFGVGRDVVVEDDGSGSIDVADVVGSFRVRDDGSGSIRHRGVGGNVDIPVERRGRRRG